MLRTLDTCRCFQPYAPKKIVQAKPEPINWTTRMKQKKDMFVTSVKILATLVAASCFFVSLPIMIVNPVLGKTILISMFPMLLVALSWMVPTWIFFDKRNLVLTMTVGMTPIRILFVLGFTYLVMAVFPVMNVLAFCIGMMLHWILFFIAEVHMMYKYFSIPRTSEEQPKIFD